MSAENTLKALAGLGKIVIHLRAENAALRALVEELATKRARKLTPAQFRAKFDAAVSREKSRTLLTLGDDNPEGAALLGADELPETDEPKLQDGE